GCSGAVPGGWNWSCYCNADLDKRAVAADSMSYPAKAAERTAAWGKSFTDIMADAPWIPVSTAHAQRRGDDAAFVDDR
ncbi:ABC transporter substrate-binding protein, partial [Rhizobium leguminosarum]